MFAAPNYNLDWIRVYCNTNEPKSHVGIDMTYKIGPYYVTTLDMPMPVFILKNPPDHHPSLLAGLSISVCKQFEDYLYLSQQLKLHGKLETLVYGTDGETAMENAFEKVFPIDGMFSTYYSGYLRHDSKT